MSYTNTTHYLTNMAKKPQDSPGKTQNNPSKNNDAVGENYSNKPPQHQNTQPSDEDYEYCPNCNRRFFAGRLRPHLKSCKEGKPLKPLKSISNDYDNPSEQSDQTTATEKTATRTKSFKITQNPNRNSILSRASAATQEDLQESKQFSKGYKEEEQKTEEPEVSEYRAQDYREAGNDDEGEERDENANGEETEQIIPGSSGTAECKLCGRSFFVERLPKHEKICAKASKKRPVFDMSKKRAVVDPVTGAKLTNPVSSGPSKSNAKEKSHGGAQKSAVSTNNETEDSQSTNKAIPKWKRDHENFINNIKFNRKLKKMEENGEDTSNMKSPETNNSDYVLCPYCQRKFAPHTADRHIPKCKTITNRPKPPKSSINEEAQTTMYDSKAKPPKPTKKIESQPNLDDVQESRPFTQYNTQKSNERAYDMRSATSYQKTPKAGAEGGTQKLFGSQRKPDALESSETHRYSRDYCNKEQGIHDTEERMTRNEFDGRDKPRKENGFLSTSPTNGMNRFRKTIISEPLPKKDELLINYQDLKSRLTNLSTVTCQHCLRNFAPKVAERHIPICQNLRNTRSVKPAIENGRIVRDTKAGFNLNPIQRKGARTSTVDPNLLNNKQERELKNEYDAMPKSASKNERFSLGKQNAGLISSNTRISKTTTEQFPKAKGTRIINELMQFCTCCGGKMMKQHRFCGHCGNKKDDIS